MGWRVWDGFGGAWVLQMCFEVDRLTSNYVVGMDDV